MATFPATLRRSILYVPGSSKKMIECSRSLAVDNVTYDLEDSVALHKKVEARLTVRNNLRQARPIHIKDQAVRINSISSGLAEKDLVEVLDAENLDTLVIPKVESASDLEFVTDMLHYKLPSRHSKNNIPSARKSPIQLLALIESAKSLSNLSSICAASPYLSGLIFAAEDFALDLSIERTTNLAEFSYARSAIVTACRANDLPSVIDLVCTHVRGNEGRQILTEECVDGKRQGFNGKQCIHPSQIDVVQRIFTPNAREIEWAVRIMVADLKAAQQGRGAWTMDGKMIDKPVTGKACSIVRKAEACGVDIQTIKDQWDEQEPE